MDVFARKKWGMRMLMFSLLLCSGFMAFSQSLRVSGQVLSAEDNSGLPGVSVLIKGTTQGTVTDINGNYSLSVPNKQSVLQFSFIGLAPQEVKVGDQSVVDIRMELDIDALEEIVVVGYGSQKKVDVTGSVVSITGETLVKAAPPALQQNLTGKLPGVIVSQESGQPGFERTLLRIRGNSTYRNNAPLILVDGVPRDWDRIDPNDVESITVLKDAASAAIYGARAANGVLIIKTKRGQLGKPTLSYSGRIGFQSPTVKPEMMNAYKYALHYNEAQINGLANERRFSDEDIEEYRTGVRPSTDWYGEALSESAAMQQHNLSLRGGTAKTKYFISLGTLDQDGLNKNSTFKRNNLSANIDTEILEGLTVSTDIAIRIEDRTRSARSETSIFKGVLGAQPTELPYVPASVDPNGLGSSGNTVGTAIGDANNSGIFNQKNTRLFTTLKLRYEFPMVKGLAAQVRYSQDRGSSSSKNFTHDYDYYVPSDDGETWSLIKSNLDNAILTNNMGNGRQDVWQLSLSYDRSIDRHTIGFTGVFESQDNQSEFLETSRTGFVSTSIDQLFAGEMSGPALGGAREAARLGYVGRLVYNYDSRYYLQTNFRYDGSFNFPKSGRWGFFPSVSAGWRLSEESFFNVNAVSNLKLRASWGKVGNDRVGDFQYLSLFDLTRSETVQGQTSTVPVYGYVFGSGGGKAYQDGIVTSVFANPLITWEKATEVNFGFELGLFKDRVSLEVDYFNKTTRDILSPNNGSITAESGFKLADSNLGIVDNEGIETLLQYQNDIGDLSYSIGGNVSYTRNKIIENGESSSTPEGLRQKGRRVGQLYGFKTLGLFQTIEEINEAPDHGQVASPDAIQPGDIRYVDVNLDGQINGKEDQQPIGRTIFPELVYGINLAAAYKGFELTANFQGASIFDRIIDLSTPFLLDGNSLDAISDSWRPNNTDARYPRLVVGGTANNQRKDGQNRSDFWMEKGDYLRLKNFEFAYNVKPAILQKAKIQSLRVYVSGTNLLTFSKNKIIDPEARNGGELFGFPLLKSYNIGLNVSF